jgi:cell division control protein 6
MPEHGKVPFTVVLISNNKNLTAMLDDRARSSLMAEEMHFDAYKPEQLKKILRTRAKHAFMEGAISEDAIALAAAHSAKLGGDARIAIESLLAAGRLAERENAEEVTAAHLRKSFSSVDAASALKAIPHLPDNEKEMLRIIAEKGGISSGELYGLFDTKCGGLSERAKRQLLDDLISLRIIKAEEVSLGNKGRTRKLDLNAGRNAVLERLGDNYLNKGK